MTLVGGVKCTSGDVSVQSSDIVRDTWYHATLIYSETKFKMNLVSQDKQP